MEKKPGISIADLFPATADELTKFPLLSEFMGWFIEDGTNLSDRADVMSALEMNLQCLASASIISSLENYQELLKNSQPKETVFSLDNGDRIIITPED